MSREVLVPQRVVAVDGSREVLDVREWVERFDRHCAYHDEHMGEGVLANVTRFLRKRVDGNFQSQAYKRFDVVGMDLFFSVREFQLRAAGLSGDEFCAALYHFVLRGAERVRDTGGQVWNKKRRQYEFRVDGGKQTMLSFFVERFAVWSREQGLDPVGSDKVRMALRLWLANQAVGVIGERAAYDVLFAEFGGRSRVRWASSVRDEKDDVDCYVNGLPISIKTYNAWDSPTIFAYRYSKGCKRPVAYVNESGIAMVSEGYGRLQELDAVEFRELVGLSS